MKISPFALAFVVALLAVGPVTAFVPTSSRIEQGFCVPTSQNLPASTTTTCFASEVDIEGTATTSVEAAPTFPFSDRQVRFAYDEWRLIYNKGDYDAERFENFKTNHKTLTISNLKAREKAAADGRPVPQWMSLNGYGDYSLDEYESMMRGEQPVANDVDQSMAYGQDEQPVRATQAVQGGDSSSSMNYNNGQVREYQDQYGRTIRSTQALTQDDPLASASSSPNMIVDSNYANNIGDDDDDDSSRGTLIIPKGEDDNEISQQRGTQVIGTNNADVRGTQVIMPNGAGAGTTFGTQVINVASESRGTQVLQSNGANAGTQVLQSSSVPGEETEFQQTDGTQIIPKNEGGTLLIPKSDDGGTQIVSKKGDTDSGGDKDDSDSLFDIFGSIFGDSGSNKDNKDEDDIDEVGKRGTMVIKRSIKAPERKPLKNPFSFFDSSGTYKEDEEETEIEEETKASNSNDFFGFLSSPKDESTATESAATTEEEEESKMGGGIFSLFGGNVKSSNPRKVRTSISLKKESGKKSQGFQKKRKTNLIPDATENETGVPPILSFFGGAKKVDEEENARNPNARATLIVKKPKKFSLFSSAKRTEGTQAITPSNNPNPLIAAQLDRQKEFAKKAALKKAETAKEREALRAERLQKQIDAKQKREAEAQARALKGKGGTQAVTPATTTKTSNSSPFSFFGAMGKQADPPTLKRWRQNRDGTITGMIYDSKSFVDGTRITTSPVARGAKKGTVVKTAGGSQYSLT